jgi:hypothetical protein
VRGGHFCCRSSPLAAPAIAERLPTRRRLARAVAERRARLAGAQRLYASSTPPRERAARSARSIFRQRGSSAGGSGECWLLHLALGRSSHRRSDRRHVARRQLARTAAERARAWLCGNALRKQPAASRACRAKRSRSFRRRGANAGGQFLAAVARLWPIQPSPKWLPPRRAPAALPAPPRNAPAAALAEFRWRGSSAARRGKF